VNGQSVPAVFASYRKTHISGSERQDVRPFEAHEVVFGPLPVRLDTDQGSFAVKELNLVDRRWPYHADDVLRLEQAAFAFEIGQILARIHALDVQWTRVPIEPAPRDWPELAERAAATRQPRAGSCS
jgi:hypothetical protein